jgi:hypothetical protein
VCCARPYATDYGRLTIAQKIPTRVRVPGRYCCSRVFPLLRYPSFTLERGSLSLALLTHPRAFLPPGHPGRELFPILALFPVLVLFPIPTLFPSCAFPPPVPLHSGECLERTRRTLQLVKGQPDRAPASTRRETPFSSLPGRSAHSPVRMRAIQPQPPTTTGRQETLSHRPTFSPRLYGHPSAPGCHEASFLT